MLIKIGIFADFDMFCNYLPFVSSSFMAMVAVRKEDQQPVNYRESHSEQNNMTRRNNRMSTTNNSTDSVKNNYSGEKKSKLGQFHTEQEVFLEETNSNKLCQKIDSIVLLYPDVTNYGYVKEIHNLLFQHKHESSFIADLREILRNDIRWSPADQAIGFHNEKTKRRDFTIYYCLALYCKRKEKD